MTERRHGGCLCGAVRYSVAWPPLAQATCSCRNCQKQAGSALSVVLVFGRDAVQLTGELRTFLDRGSSGQDVHRQFCPACGSPVLTDTPRAREQDILFVKGGTLDETGDLQPETHYWQASAQHWMIYPPHHQRLEQE